MQDLRNLIEKINTEEGKRLAENFRFMEEQKIKKTLGPNLWEQLKAALKANCESVVNSSPSQLEYNESGIYRVTITDPRTGRSAVLNYDDQVPCVFYKTPSDKDHMAFRVSADGNSVQLLIKGIPRSLDEIAMVIVSQVLG